MYGVTIAYLTIAINLRLFRCAVSKFTAHLFLWEKSRREEVYQMNQVQKAIELVMHGGLRKYKAKNSSAVLSMRVARESKEARIIDGKKNKRGSIFITRTKENLSGAGGTRGVVLSSEEAVLDHVGQATHWTPNVFNFGTYVNNSSIIKGHEEKNLQQINCFVVDVDSKQASMNEICEIAMITGFGVPTMILETPKGFHLYYVLDKPVYVSNNKDYVSIKVAKRISQNMRLLFAEHLPSVDLKCNHFGFFRMPSQQNIVMLFEENTYTFKSLIEWSKRYDDDRKHDLYVVVNNNKSNQKRQIDDAWFKQVINYTDVMPKMTDVGRNNAIFTLSLACYQSKISIGQVTNMMDEFNSNLDIPLDHREVRSIVMSAYSGKYQAATKYFINLLLETYGKLEETSVTNSNTIWRKHKKKREDRVRSHAHEWEQDIMQYLSKNAHGRSVLFFSQNELCQELGMARSTLNKVLASSKKIFKSVDGKGKNAKTGLSTISMIFTYIIKLNKEKQHRYYSYFKRTYPELHIELFEERNNGVTAVKQLDFGILEGLPAG